MMTAEDGGVCEWCRVTINTSGQARADYKWAGLDRQGSDALDEDVSEWSDQEVREVVAGIIGVEDGIDEIEIHRR